MEESAALEIHVQIDGGDEVAIELSDEAGVDPGQQLAGVVRDVPLRGGRRLHHRRNQRGRDAVARDVSHQYAEAVLIHLHTVVQVAADGCHREAPRRQVGSLRAR